ncbi:hypothetical protein NB231_10513 [Nitrococcus mobilis Nb-231]|uniref:Uncharacterized protein n=1 Tax=Nitrococcus mobilis Nb-231 TaxID=314278 RepID=A4BNT0_9GAMM|nr:hypothetical protein NB231_10513 [Nitrococcus mobilis Nb-231]
MGDTARDLQPLRLWLYQRRAWRGPPLGRSLRS